VLNAAVVVELKAEDEHNMSRGEWHHGPRQWRQGGGGGFAGQEELVVEVLGDEDPIAAVEVHLLTATELPA
jgi:hypothetical protein